MSVFDEDADAMADMSKLPALQGLLERMESQAGRVVANELKALVSESGYGALDEIGREKLEQLCADFHDHCTNISRENELLALQCRVQALAANVGFRAEEVPEVAEPEKKDTREAAKLRVPTTRRVYSWWDPRYWPIARPTDFCYGDCVWGLEHQPMPMAVHE